MRTCAACVLPAHTRPRAHSRHARLHTCTCTHRPEQLVELLSVKASGACVHARLHACMEGDSCACCTAGGCVLVFVQLAQPTHAYLVPASLHLAGQPRRLLEGCAHTPPCPAPQVEGPLSGVLHENAEVAEGQFAFTTKTEGEYRACFSVRGEPALGCWRQDF